jgi:hypothetical protein
MEGLTMQQLPDPAGRISACLKHLATQVHSSRAMSLCCHSVHGNNPGMNSSHSPGRQLRRYVTRLSQFSIIFFNTVIDSGTSLLEYLDQLGRRARRCPFACFLKVLLITSFVVALDIAVYSQGAMTFHEYSVFVMSIAYVAVLVIITNTNCRLQIPR